MVEVRPGTDVYAADAHRQPVGGTGDGEREAGAQLRDLLQASLGRYDTASKQSTKSFLTETIDTKDTARDKLTMVIEWVARYWMKLPDEEDAVRGRRVYQPFKDLTVSLPVTTRPFMLAA